MMPSDAPRILLADDDVAISALLRPILERSGYRVATVGDGESALRQVRELRPDLIVLDVLMPGLNGREVCRRLRASGDWTPVIMLTQVDSTLDRVQSLEEGADDYLAKPFDAHELIARIRAVLRRREQRVGRRPLATAERLAAERLVVDRRRRRAWLDGAALELTPKGFALLEFFMIHPDEVLTRERLLDAVWSWDYPVATRAVDVRVAELRRALGDERGEPTYIETIVGEGYRWLSPVELPDPPTP
jgi:DNA-binding response OmpR family regulator